MALTTKERQQRYRQNLKKKAYKRLLFSVPPETYEKLKALAVTRRLTQDQLIESLIDDAYKAEKKGKTD